MRGWQQDERGVGIERSIDFKAAAMGAGGGRTAWLLIHKRYLRLHQDKGDTRQGSRTFKTRHYVFPLGQVTAHDYITILSVTATFLVCERAVEWPREQKQGAELS